MHWLLGRGLVPSLVVTLSLIATSHAQLVPGKAPWDTQPSTWVAADGLGRKVPNFDEVGPPRKDRFIGVFYFLWLGNFNSGGPFDVTQILKADPMAMGKPTVPPWGPYYAPHHWGQSRFGYYVSEDEYVLRKHAQMLSDAGVDVIIFDTSNDVTYKSTYMKLLQVFSQVRSEGGRTPQVAFLCPFGTPGRVVHELYQDLYSAGLYKDLWFQWKGKPLIMADPERIGNQDKIDTHTAPVDVGPQDKLSDGFEVDQPLVSVGAEIATYGTTTSAVTVSLYHEGDSGRPIKRQRFDHALDDTYLKLRFSPPLPAGKYRLELSTGSGRVSWWTHTDVRSEDGKAVLNGVPTDARLSLSVAKTTDLNVKIDAFFTFRAPQPSYFAGPSKPNMWSWLEVYPQHVFKNADGQREQMSVGVAQNAVESRLGSMSEIGAKGRTWHNGSNDPTPGAIDRGLNFQEQAERALKEDPEFVFITGWNEWVAGRFPEFAGVKLPVMFVDEFNQEFSRDIEPMIGGHGDNYYYQMVSFIRRFKGVEHPPKASEPKTIDLQADFSQWSGIKPEYRDNVGDTFHRDNVGWSKDLHYVNSTGRNDLATMKVARDSDFVYFYVRTRDPITPYTDPHWMMLFLKVGVDSGPNWAGYQFVLNRQTANADTCVLEQSTGGWNWIQKAKVKYRVVGNEMEVAIRKSDLGIDSSNALRIEFKWMDNMQNEGEISDFDLFGDAAPNGRFNYLYVAPPQ